MSIVVNVSGNEFCLLDESELGVRNPEGFFSPSDSILTALASLEFSGIPYASLHVFTCKLYNKDLYIKSIVCLSSL